MRIDARRSADLTNDEAAAVRQVLADAFERDEHGGFTWDDWLHALGGTHFVLVDDGGAIIGHASVVERELHVDDRPLRTGYVEAVAIHPSRQREGLGSVLMTAVNAHVDAEFELGGLGTGKQPFYERLGWVIWQGPLLVRTERGVEATPEEQGYILVRRTPRSPELTLAERLSCEWRPGDAW